MHGTALVLTTVGCAVVLFAFAAASARKVRRVMGSSQPLPAKLKVEAGVMGIAVAMFVVEVGLSVLGS